MALLVRLSRPDDAAFNGKRPAFLPDLTSWRVKSDQQSVGLLARTLALRLQSFTFMPPAMVTPKAPGGFSARAYISGEPALVLPARPTLASRVAPRAKAEGL